MLQTENTILFFSYYFIALFHIILDIYPLLNFLFISLSVCLTLYCLLRWYSIRSTFQSITKSHLVSNTVEGRLNKISLMLYDIILQQWQNETKSCVRNTMLLLMKFNVVSLSVFRGVGGWVCPICWRV